VIVLVLITFHLDRIALFLGLGADLYDCGFSNITNIDISTVVINQMGSLYANREEMECKRNLLCFLHLSITFLFITVSVMDVRNMEYVPEQCFDLVIDKGIFLSPSISSIIHIIFH